MESHFLHTSKTQLAAELADLELEVERLQKDSDKTQGSFAKNKTGARAGAFIFLIIGIVLCVTGVGAIFGFPMICIGIVGLVRGGNPTKKEQATLANIQSELLRKKKRLTELRAMVQVGNSTLQTDDDEVRVKCPYCAERILQEAKICRFCGNKIN